MARRSPARTPEGRENQLIAKAVDLAEQQLEDGSASAQVITHYLKLGSSRERLEQEQIRYRNELLVAQKESLDMAGAIVERIDAAMAAFKSYSTTSEVPAQLTYSDDPSQLQ